MTVNPPLAELLRPKTLDDVIGQSHLLAKGKPLRMAFDSGKPHSMILWGPPGVGKTTLARLTAQAFDCEWIALSAVFSGVKDIRAAMDAAQHFRAMNRHTLLFIDEIHRFNKAQQDALLPYTESGLVTFIGATTENPSFEVNKALLSRAQVYVLQSLSDAELKQLLQRAQQHMQCFVPVVPRLDRGIQESGYDAESLDPAVKPRDDGHGKCQQTIANLQFDIQAEETLIAYADGDARRLLNLFEQTCNAAKLLSLITIDGEFVRNTLTLNSRHFDKNGDHLYDQISALHKSVRGSNPDAALYWLCRMLDGGVDANYLARRIVRMAWEDIGLADPRAMQIANDAAATYDRLGSPEGELALAQAVIYLSIAAKSNAGYTAYNKAAAFVKKDKSRDVPIHLRNAPTSLMKKMGHGEDYRYAHDEPHGFAAGVNYMPEGLKEPGWYQPVDRGLERKIAQKMDFLSRLNAQGLG